MKDYKLHILQRIAAFFIMFAFLLPAVVSFIHSTQDHNHYDTCAFGNATHVHEKKLDCDLGDLHILNDGFYAFAKAYHTPYSYYKKSNDVHKSTSYIATITTSSDRGPPSC